MLYINGIAVKGIKEVARRTKELKGQNYSYPDLLVRGYLNLETMELEAFGPDTANSYPNGGYSGVQFCFSRPRTCKQIAESIKEYFDGDEGYSYFDFWYMQYIKFRFESCVIK